MQKPAVIHHPSPHHSARPKGSDGDIDTIVLHHTAGTTGLGDLAWMCNPKSELSAHYLVDRDGTIYQLVEDSRRAWHAGKSELEVRGDVNDFSIGIEIANLGDGKDPYTEEQYLALEQLVSWLCHEYKVSTRRIVAHKDIALPKGRKTDPSPNFDMERIKRAAARALLGVNVS